MVSSQHAEINHTENHPESIALSYDLTLVLMTCRRVGRELEKWIPDGPDMVSLDDMSLEMGGYSHGGWDQFAANETMYGVKTSFDEAIYTTTIDRNNSKITEQEAARIAREIERGQMDTTNVHLLEERNMAIDDSGVDEEDKYSSVMRNVASPAPKEPKKPAWSTAGAGVAVLQGAKEAKVTEAPQPPPPPAGMAAVPVDAKCTKQFLLCPSYVVRALIGAAVGVAFVTHGSSVEIFCTRLPSGGALLPVEMQSTIHVIALVGADIAIFCCDLSILAALCEVLTCTTKRCSIVARPLGRQWLAAWAATSPPQNWPEFVSYLQFRQPEKPKPEANDAGTKTPATITSTAEEKAPEPQSRPPAEEKEATEPSTSGKSEPAAEKPKSEETKKPAVKSSLNPNAKPFKLNVNAAAFVPGGSATRSGTTGTSSSSPGSASSSVGGGGGGGGHHNNKSRNNSGGGGGNWSNNSGPHGGMGGPGGGQGWGMGGMPPHSGWNGPQMGMPGMMPGMGPGQPRPGMMPPGGYGAPYYQMPPGGYYPSQPFMNHSSFMGSMPPGSGQRQGGGYVPYGAGMPGMGMGPDGHPTGGGGK
eukprot:scaffold135525_cov40-Prasinocladus_malaysianus.AAC.1